MNSENVDDNIIKTKDITNLNIANVSFQEVMKNVGASLKVFEDFSATLGDSLYNLQKNINKVILPIVEILENLDIDKVKLNLYRTEFQDNEKLVKRLTEERIFTPINYLAYNTPVINENIDLIEWILSNEIKEFYISRIDKWKEKYEDNSINNLISEIKIAFKKNMNYSVCLLIFPLIERMLREELINREGHVKYSDIRDVLREEAFEIIGVVDIYEVFIEKNLYCDTKKAEEFSRHISHGVKLDFINSKVAINMILIYDYLQDIISFKKR